MTCPHCNTTPGQIFFRAITLNDGKGSKWNGLAYSCPSCAKILSVGFDPIALKTDLVEEVREIFRRH